MLTCIALLRRYGGSIKSLLRRYEGAIKTLVRRYEGAIKALVRRHLVAGNCSRMLLALEALYRHASKALYRPAIKARRL